MHFLLGIGQILTNCLCDLLRRGTFRQSGNQRSPHLFDLRPTCNKILDCFHSLRSPFKSQSSSTSHNARSRCLFGRAAVHKCLSRAYSSLTQRIPADMEELSNSRILLDKIRNLLHLGELCSKSETFQRLFAADPFHNVFSGCTHVFTNSVGS